jgi:hypothetical protein
VKRKKSAKRPGEMLTVEFASPEPSIVWSLRAILNPETQSPERLAWIKDGLREMLKIWDHGEDLEELKRHLGVAGDPRRRRNSTQRRETTVVAAIINAALAGHENAKTKGAEESACDTRSAQRYWKKWGAFYLRNLESQKPFVSADDQQRICRAIDILTARDSKS